MTGALLLGIAAGGGLMLLATGFLPARVPLDRALDRLDTPAVRERTDDRWWVQALGAPLVDTGIGHAATQSVRRDLRIIGRTTAEHLARCVALVGVALLWAPVTFGLMAVGGVHVSWVLPLWVSLVLSAAAAVVPTLAVRAEATERRRSFRHALGCFLDLVAVRLAGGAGVDSALAGSAAAGEGGRSASYARRYLKRDYAASPRGTASRNSARRSASANFKSWRRRPASPATKAPGSGCPSPRRPDQSVRAGSLTPKVLLKQRANGCHCRSCC